MKNPLVPFTLLLFGFFIFSCALQRERTHENPVTAEARSSTEKASIDRDVQNYRHKTASELLSKSPRHHEWVTLTHGNGEL